MRSNITQCFKYYREKGDSLIPDKYQLSSSIKLLIFLQNILLILVPTTYLCIVFLKKLRRECRRSQHSTSILESFRYLVLDQIITCFNHKYCILIFLYCFVFWCNIYILIYKYMTTQLYLISADVNRLSYF